MIYKIYNTVYEWTIRSWITKVVAASMLFVLAVALFGCAALLISLNAWGGVY